MSFFTADNEQQEQCLYHETNVFPKVFQSREIGHLHYYGEFKRRLLLSVLVR